MKKISLIMLFTAALTSMAPLAQAHPGPGPDFGHGPAPFFHPGHRVDILPDIATALLIGGLTYYVANGIYYQRQNDHYVVVEPPTTTVVEAPSSGSLHPLDFNGRRYYVSDGHYYERDVDGRYIEVPRPAGL
ncbi:DUF6515 family protein [Mangrovibacter yixingensis]|uniref:DUF6515 family protein n=1 Tax=Mangrovibacter yixingensis TaxID=1529639 RepID=UPI001CFA2E76|nr:DUF6515 family protein [Mangrovibacter yixingensis]